MLSDERGRRHRHRHVGCHLRRTEADVEEERDDIPHHLHPKVRLKAARMSHHLDCLHLDCVGWEAECRDD